MISQEDGKEFLKLARDSVKTYFSDEEPTSALKERFQEKRGVFVTLHKDGRLRGCIGYPEPVIPLFEAVIDSARSAAFKDPRFPPVKKEELDGLHIEISILTVPKEMRLDSPDDYPKQITIGKDGLIIRGQRSGLLLPQVAEEWKFSPTQFLEAVSEKAGMDKDAWKDNENRIFTFQAQIFKE